MFELQEKNGISLKNGLSIRIDPVSQQEADLIFISHGHSDHAKIPAQSQAEFILSPETHCLLEDKFNENHKISPTQLKTKVRLENFSFSLHNSGHILGAVQVFFEGAKNITVTNDFKLQDSLIQEKAEILPCDVLILETTFGLPEFNFPPRETVYEQIGHWVRENIRKNRFVLLSGYSLGKAQELTRVINEFAGETPLVYETVFKFNERYQRKGVKLGEFIKLNHNLNEANVLILPPRLVNQDLKQFLSHALQKKVVSAMATGWQFRNCFEKIFPLSDHADFKQLMAYVEQAQPKMVFTRHGFAREFACYVERRLKIPAQPLAQYKQKNLLQFTG